MGKMKKDIAEEIKQMDYAFLEASFFIEKEISTRDTSEIPHPFIIESREKFKGHIKKEKAKVILSILKILIQ